MNMKEEGEGDRKKEDTLTPPRGVMRTTIFGLQIG